MANGEASGISRPQATRGGGQLILHYTPARITPVSYLTGTRDGLPDHLYFSFICLFPDKYSQKRLKTVAKKSGRTETPHFLFWATQTQLKASAGFNTLYQLCSFFIPLAEVNRAACVTFSNRTGVTDLYTIKLIVRKGLSDPEGWRAASPVIYLMC